MKYFLDCEFFENGETIDLISIAIVAEDGREYYAVNADCDFDRIWTDPSCEWLRSNVMPYIDRGIAIPRAQIRDEMRKFVFMGDENGDKHLYDGGKFEAYIPSWYPIEMWGYYSAYDWVAVAQIFGRMIDLPKNFPMFCRDIKQERTRLGDPELPAQGENEHHALDDARWNKRAYDWLVAYEARKLALERSELVSQIFS